MCYGGNSQACQAAVNKLIWKYLPILNDQVNLFGSCNRQRLKIFIVRTVHVDRPDSTCNWPQPSSKYLAWNTFNIFNHQSFWSCDSHCCKNSKRELNFFFPGAIQDRLLMKFKWIPWHGMLRDNALCFHAWRAWSWRAPAGFARRDAFAAIPSPLRTPCAVSPDPSSAIKIFFPAAFFFEHFFLGVGL